MASKQFNSVDGYSVGSVATTVVDANSNISGNAITATANVTSPRFISNVATGTAPFVVNSTTQVANLNVATAGTAGSATTAGTVTTAAQPNITSVGTLTSLGVNGTVTAVAFTANTGVFTGNGSGLSAIAGANVTGTVSSATTATTAGTVTTAAQPNITSVGTLTSLGVSGNITAANITANTGVFTGNGSGLTALNASNISSGTLAQARLANASLTLGNTALTLGSTTTTVTGLSSVTSTTFVGALTGAATTAGTVTTAAQPNITSVGTLTSLAVSGNATAANIGVTGNVTAANITANTGIFSGNGSGLTALNASNLSSGTVPSARLSGSYSISVTGSAGTAGTVTTAAQPNITSVGTLSSLSVTGNVAAGNLTTTGVLSVTGTGQSSIAGNLDMTSNNIVNLATPVNPTDAATKQYVDDLAQGLHTHDSCNAATNTTLASISGGTVTYNNGSSGVGATLTTTGSYTTIDGVTLSNGMRILVKNEANAAHNGIYDRTSTTVLTRSTDFDTPTEMAGGDFTFVTAGTLYDNTGWVMTDPVTTVGTTDVNWVQFSGAGTYTAGTGLTLTGSQFSVNASQTQITSVGTLSGLNVNGTVTASAFTANTGVFTGNGSGLTAIAGANVTGTVASATSATTAGTVTTAAQPNITSVGTLTSLGVNGTITGVNITANTGVFSGNGSSLTALNASNISTGTLAQARLANASVTLGSTALTLGSTVTTVAGLSSVTSTTFVGSLSGAATTAGTVTTAAQPNITSVGTLTSLGVNGTVTAVAFTANTGVFTGNGSGLSAIAGANVTGTVSSATTATTATTAGTVTTAAQPNITSVGTLTSLGVNGTITGVNITANTGVFTGSGSGLTTLNASNISSGTLAQARLANASVTLGSTALTLGSTVTTVAGLSSVTSTTFVGTLSGAATTAGTVTTAAQPNITSTGTLTSLTVSGGANLASSSGNVGIGLTAPKTKLQVTGLTTLNAPVLGNAANAPLYVTSSDSAYGLVVGTTASDGHVWLQAQRTDGTATAYNITLNEGGGNVGIGNTAPAHKLSVTGTTSLVGNVTIQSNVAYVAPNGANTINSQMLNGGTLSWSGNAGQLFSITDSMTGNIFTVNDVSGIPMISVDAGGNIQFAASGGFVSYGVTTGITAAGSTQGTATSLTRPINVVSTVSASTGVILPTVPAGARIVVMNTSGTALNVYPPSGAAINSGSTNAAYSMPAGTRLEFISVSTTQWYTLNATYG